MAVSASPTELTSSSVAGGIIDTDVHPILAGGILSLFPYMTEGWRKRLETRGVRDISYLPSGRYLFPYGRTGVNRLDATPPDGGPPASNPEYLAKHHLDAHGISGCMLLSIEASNVTIWANPSEATVLASAFNDFHIERWLSTDPRFRYAMVVSPQDPVAAAAEIRRVGSHAQVAAVWIHPFNNVLIGKPYYHEVFAAAQELGLPVLIHPNAGDGNYQGTSSYAGGVASSFAERTSGFAQMGIAQLASAVFDGLFERFPKLHLVLTEYGWTWVPSTLWRMDAVWQGQRSDVPWVKRPPSDYVREHVRFTSQPATELPPQDLPRFLELISAERTLMFSTDYPHFDSDEPELVLKSISPELRQRIMHDNAVETYGYT